MEFFEFIETDFFSGLRKKLLTEEEYTEFQKLLIVNPEAGSVMVGTGGCRKIRFSPESYQKGKSGAVRVIYYYQSPEGRIWLFLLYQKGQKDTLTGAEKNTLKSAISLLKEGKL
ncbi:TPA: addiction module toxin RelE [Salmonella enterica]|uniref:Addiction module toxin RelE n=1 Tax=Salmonella enterica TaxID=28901 RepID=A0A760BGT9_SALER|nr:addiction module toxin RelE [Salmonella enterica]